MTPGKKEKWLRVAQIVEDFNLKKSTVYELIAAGHFRAYRISDTGKGGIRVSRESVQRYVENRVALFQLETGILSADK